MAMLSRNISYKKAVSIAAVLLFAFSFGFITGRMHKEQISDPLKKTSISFNTAPDTSPIKPASRIDIIETKADVPKQNSVSSDSKIVNARGVDYARFYALLAEPDYNLVLKQQESENARKCYTEFLQILNLKPEQAKQVIEIMAEKRMSKFDAASMAGDAMSQTAIKAAQLASEELNNQLKLLIGDPNTKALLEFESMLGPTKIAQTQVESLDRRLVFSEMPLATDQKKSLQNILSSNMREKDPGKLLEKISTVLGADQLAAYIDMQEEQKFQQLVFEKYKSVHLIKQ